VELNFEAHSVKKAVGFLTGVVMVRLAGVERHGAWYG
jgi:hypothetical protein